MKKHLSQSITSSSLAAQFERNISQIPYLSSLPLSSALSLGLNSNENLPQNSTDDEDSSEFSEEEDEEEIEDEEDDDLETNSLSIEDTDEMGQQQATSSSS